MAVLVLFGQMRTFDSDLITESYNKYLSGYGKIDLYISTWSDRGSSYRHGNHDINIKSTELITRDQIYSYYSKFNFFNIKDIVVEDFTTFLDTLDDKIKDLYNTRFNIHTPVSTSIPVSYKWQTIINRIKDEYDQVIVTRPDFYIDKPIPSTGPCSFYKTHTNNCIDHMFMSSSNIMKKVLGDIFLNFIELNNELPPDMSRDINEILILNCTKKGINIECAGSYVAMQVFYNG